MTLDERLTQAHALAARLYLQRQDVELQRQQLAQRGAQIDLALAKSDGEIALLEALIAEEKAGSDGE